MDATNEVVTFPLWSIEPFASQNRKLVGYQRYQWNETKARDNGGRYFTWVSESYKDRIAYGIENCYGHGPLFIVEGIWDALSVVNCYFDCLACLCCSPSKNLKAHLRQIAGKRPIVALCDNDGNPDSRKLGSWVDDMFFTPDGYKDTNSMPHEILFDWLTNVRSMVQCKYGNY